MRRRYARALRRFVVSSREEAMQFAASMYRGGNWPGAVVAVFLGPGGKFVELFNVADGGDDLHGVVQMLCQVMLRRAESLFIVTDRTGEVPADRPDDELTWMRLHAAADDADLVLLDWLVVVGSKAFSVTEFAPIPAGWAPVDHGC